MKFQIKDFVGLHHLDIETYKHTTNVYVLITQRAGAMSFQHTMRPEQARFMAAALTMAADEADAQQGGAA